MIKRFIRYFVAQFVCLYPGVLTQKVIIVNFKTNETVNFIDALYSQVKADCIAIAQDKTKFYVHLLSENHGNA